VSPFHPDEYPHRLESGTVSIPGIAGLHAAQKWFAELGKSQGTISPDTHYEACRAALKHIHAIGSETTQQLIDTFDAIPGVIMYGPRGDQPRISTFSINIGDLPAEQVGLMLDADHGICVRSGLHCAPVVHEDQGTLKRNGTVRFAPGFFTDEEDVAQAIDGVQSIAEYQASRTRT
jgi:selenocysteine lyase/cysteine desulfurase